MRKFGRTFAVIFGVVAAVLFGSTPAFANADHAYNICNNSYPYSPATQNYVYAIHGHDGSYVNGDYDSLLPSGYCTRPFYNWTDGTAGYFLPAGTCAEEYTANHVFIRLIDSAGHKTWRWFSCTCSYNQSYIIEYRGC